MPSYFIPNTDLLRREILASKARCRQYGIDPSQTQNLDQVRLSEEQLADRMTQNEVFLRVATAQVKEIYQFVAGAGFAAVIADRDGYLLKVIGDGPVLEKLAAGNCAPGYRWTERDVGTSATSLVLERKIPVQIREDEHYCKRGHGFTCSACPVFGVNNKLAGVIALSGEVDQVHPHTLGMVITAAKAIENQMRIENTSEKLLLQNNYMNAIIEAIDSGVIAVDRNGIIAQINSNGKRILQRREDIEGRHLSEVLGTQIDVKQILYDGSGYRDQEIFVRGSRRDMHLMNTAKPIFDLEGQVQGIIIVFNEIDRIRNLVNKMAGTQARFTFEDIIGVSPVLQDAKNLAMLAAQSSSSVLLMGETGTGKELFAQAIHNQSERRALPFVAINCGAIPRELIESELFGYVEGAFTGARKGGRPGKFELASGGTILLDEIGDMPQDMQVKLLRVLQTGEVLRIGEHKPIRVDLRIIAATHWNLKDEVEKMNFREDLFYRLNVFPIQIPPLRERTEDIMLLAKRILDRCSRLLKKEGLKFSPEAERFLCRYHWPGNIRELENVVERAVHLVTGQTIEPEFLSLPVEPDKKHGLAQDNGYLLSKAERQTIQDTIEKADFNVSRAAKMLGITRATLYKKIKKYDILLHRAMFKKITCK